MPAPTTQTWQLLVRLLSCGCWRDWEHRHMSLRLHLRLRLRLRLRLHLRLHLRLRLCLRSHRVLHLEYA
jgi:hypothetical protein